MGRLRATIAIACLAGSIAGAGGSAWAHGAGGEQLPKDAPAVTPDGTKAKAELDVLAKDERAAAIAHEAIEAGRRALARAHGASLAGDVDGARLLSRVALAWSKGGSAAFRAGTAEKRTTDAELKTKELKERLARTRALLAETETRRGQVAAELQRAEAAAKDSAERAAKTEQKRIEKGPAPAPKKPAGKKEKSQ